MKTIEKKLDRLFQQLSNGKLCAICGNTSNCSHHIIPRKNLSTRWDKINCMPVCIQCHNAIHNGNINTNYYLTKERINYLNKKKNEIIQPIKEWYEEREKELK